MELHHERRRRIKDVLVDVLSGAHVSRGSILDLSTLRELERASIQVPKGRMELLTTWISDTPIRDFVVEMVQAKMRAEAKYDPARDPYPLVELPSFSNLPELSDHLIAELESLPWRYTFFFPLPLKVEPFAEKLFSRGSFPLSPTVVIVKGNAIPADFALPQVGESYILQILNADTPRAWVPDQLYLRVNLEGFMGEIFDSATLARALSLLRSFLGLALSLPILSRKLQFQLSPVFVILPKALAYREIQGQYVGLRPRDIHQEIAREIPKLTWNDSLQEAEPAAALKDLALLLGLTSYAFKEAPECDSLRRAAQWFFDSYCNDNDLLGFVQAMVSLEILLGDKKTSDIVGIGQLLANRCAYFIGSTSRERSEILEQFIAIYDTRSKIVHRGQNILSARERADLYTLWSMCRRVIYKELRLLVANDVIG